MFNKKVITMMTSIILVGTMAVGCGSKKSSSGESTKITISGSTSVGPLMEKEAKAFEDKNKGISIEVNQTGSSAGIKDAITGISEIGMSSRDLKDEEKNAGLKETKIAYDGIAVVVNPKNEVKNLTIDQVKQIYTGKITNWKDVGGKDAPIVVVSREDGSGTRDAFQEIVGYKSENLKKDAQISDGSGNIKTTVAGNENAIGFVSEGYVDDTIRDLTIDGVKVESKTIKDKTYKIARAFILVHKDDNLSENAKKLMEFILSEEGQKIVADDKLTTIN